MMLETKRLPYALLAVASLALLPAATCDDKPASSSSVNGDGGTDPARGEASTGTSGEASPYVASGRAVDTTGAALAGVEVVIDNQLIDDSNLVGTTGADGRYRLELPQLAVTWNASATHSVDYHGTRYRFPLHPSDAQPFAGNAGAVRDFTWKLTGNKPEGGTYGGFVTAYRDLGDTSFDISDVELELEPDGPLVDGSQGARIARKLVPTPDGDAVEDVPVGRYRIQAHVDGAPLLVRIRNTEGYAASVTSDFDVPHGSLPIYRIELELRRN